jgi:hypothetical protein
MIWVGTDKVIVLSAAVKRLKGRGGNVRSTLLYFIKPYRSFYGKNPTVP